MTRINILTAKNDGHETIYAPESIELKIELTQVLTCIRDGCFVVAITCVCPSRDNPAETVQVGREYSYGLESLREGEEAAWRATGALPHVTRHSITMALWTLVEHEVNEMYHDANGVRVADPHKDGS